MGFRYSAGKRQEERRRERRRRGEERRGEEESRREEERGKWKKPKWEMKGRDERREESTLSIPGRGIQEEKEG